MKQASRNSADRLVGIASGQIPVRAFDESRLAFRLVVTLVGVALLGSGWLVWRTITTSAKLPPPKNVNQLSTRAEITALKSKDTDGDSLSDYDELYVYSSSPYLFSSAGDETSDGEKVLQGLNPNCQKGKTCTAPTVDLSTGNSNQVSVDFLRQALKASGAPAATVDQADDATILSLYQEALGTAVVSNTNTTGASAAPVTVTDLEKLTAAQIRALLRENGVDTSTLQSVDDNTLKAIFQQAIQSSQ